MRSEWRIELLGGLRASSGNLAVERFQTHKTAALFAFLAYFSHRSHPRTELVELLWPEAEPDAGRNRLTQALVWLRHHLEPPGTPAGSVLQTDRQSVALNPTAIVTDVQEFEAGIKVAGPTGPAEAEALRKAIDLYRGELLPGFDEQWLLAERQRLRELLVRSLRRLAAYLGRSGDSDAAIAYLRRALSVEPAAEEIHCDIVQLLVDSGQPAAALRQFREMEQELDRVLGEEPSPAARALQERIRQGARLPSAAPALRSSPSRALLTPLTRFFGREAEIAAIEEMLRSSSVRLVTLLGTGGCGKTRLAIETAARLSARQEGAVYFVPLADLTESRSVLTALADTLGVTPTLGVSVIEQIAERLLARPSLVILDNLEHLLEEVAPLIRDLLQRVPNLTILVTSRQRLGINGEREVAVPPLPVPQGRFLEGREESAPRDLMGIDSVRLFVDRAQAVRPGFQITAQNARTVALLCQKLEGIPLAIELCAAWAQTLTPTQILDRLSHRFDLLISRRTDIPARHRTLRVAIEYSYQQLSPDLRSFFTRLSLFRGGWTLEAAEAICLGAESERAAGSRALEFLTDLRERSLVIVDEIGLEMRYRMLETLREFAAERWSDADSDLLLRRHIRYFLGVAEAASAHLTRPEQAVWLGLLETELDNFRAALQGSLVERDADTGLRLASALTPFWEARGYLSEGQQWLERLLALKSEGTADTEALSVRARALTALGQLARNQGDSAEVNAAIQEALALWRRLGDERGITICLQVLATRAYSREDCDEARGYLQESLLLARQLGDRALIARALLNLGNLALEQSDWPEAWALYTESLNLFREEGDRNRIAHALNNIGLVARYQGEYGSARALWEESLAISRELSDRATMAVTLLNLSAVDRLEGKSDSARACIAEATTISHEVGERRLVAWGIRELGHMLCSEGRYAEGIRLLAAAESLRSAMGLTFKPADPGELEQAIAPAREALGEAGFASAWASGSGMSLAQSVTEILRCIYPA